ncbi:nucleotide exchange factor GrpE [Catenuloplanes atrovinosus]|uniref:Protein GrpE n=1 Tax=Catenuloplanes atrovinosus TaxID=137266 RepID=A0AAE4CD07_9ACTN|nr:nucleotide exchange factor GrpE [Catenuloplanes atrovinosus]MDR7280151.1 molecular chaperone GrpE [Catenuloplanes atrovinosus]
MTDERKPAEDAGSPDRERSEEGKERVVIRDRRKIDPSVAKPDAKKSGKPEESEVVEPDEVLDPEPSTTDATDAEHAEDTAEAPAAQETKTERKPEQKEKEERVGKHAAPTPPLSAELEALRTEVEDRTRDLQRVTAEYANYRKRVERDRAAQSEQATGSVLSALLPVLDDLDRAREHGDLVGPFASVAEQLTAALGKFGLTAFGEKGDVFDPNRHEAVAHLTSADVTEPTCIDVMRRGYSLGNRLLRPALVAVADPE